MGSIYFNSMSARFSLIFVFLFTCLRLVSQETNVLTFVNPFIGTAKTEVHSLWGVDGGTYPGAVAPFGFIQLSPETSVTETKGYNYADHSIYYFSCINHASGYPEGSAGSIFVMPVEAKGQPEIGKYSRPFFHKDEKATPGYYSVLFRDNGTLAEMSATEHTGMFRFTFPKGVQPKILVGDLGKIEVISDHEILGSKSHVTLVFNSGFILKEEIGSGTVLTFPVGEKGKNVLLVKISTSTLSYEGASNNLKREADNWDFDIYKAKNQKKWVDALSIISVEDTSKTNKTIFYTALYHSQLLPWIVSDADGKYKGGDGMEHLAKGKNQYSHFSPWDTFRSLHPLLTIITPERQNDMINSLLDTYIQTGKLPKGPMTGNHVIPIIVDAWMKGVCNYDSSLAYLAMKKCLADENNSQDFLAYKSLGYVPSTCSESVTQTVEYAYNDWVLAQFAGKVIGDKAEYQDLLNRSFNYRNLFNGRELFLLPRNKYNWSAEPANFGYKEGDKWSYSWFVPHNNRDLINLLGGNEQFTAKLDSGLSHQLIPFDNEPVVHIPYLFNYACHPEKTQKWVREFLATHYKNSQDGLPGNDDLGSMSSWYVFSAMGFFPVCPGRPVYDLGSPLFKKVTIHLKDGKNFVVNSVNNNKSNRYVKEVKLNGYKNNKLYFNHTDLKNGGELSFTMTGNPGDAIRAGNLAAAPSETVKTPEIVLSNVRLLQRVVRSGEQLPVDFSLENKGSIGTKTIRLYTDGKEVGQRSFLLKENELISDSIVCRLYVPGSYDLKVENSPSYKVIVRCLEDNCIPIIDVSAIHCTPIIQKGEPADVILNVKNRGGASGIDTLYIYLDNRCVEKKGVTLAAGEVRKINSKVFFQSDGMHQIKVGKMIRTIKVYSDPKDGKVIDLSTKDLAGKDTISDGSGLSNCGFVRRIGVTNAKADPFLTDANCWIEVDNNGSLDQMGTTITVMAWVLPTSTGRGRISDILTKGDFINFQCDGRNLSFFAGGWGRGSVSAPLPNDWLNNWHHIAGVSDGNSLKIYIDGVETGSQFVGPPVDLSTKARWMLGRNEEFPDQRYFYGGIDRFKVFTEPLKMEDIKQEMETIVRKDFYEGVQKMTF